jgi:hypothetical protein
MKINVDVDITPEELRVFMGLPDVQGLQQQMLESFAANMQNSQDQQEQFVRNLIEGSLAPWQNFFSMLSGAGAATNINVNDSK